MDFNWNNANLGPPPMNIVKVKRPNKPDIILLKSIVNTSLEFYSSLKDIPQCGAYCSRLLAKRKSSFRHFGAFRDLEKVNSALHRWLRLDIEQTLQNFSGLLPDYIGSELKFEVPYRDSLDYVLIRLRAVYELAKRIMDSTLECAIKFSQIIRSNFFFEYIVIVLSLLAQIWKLSKEIGANTTIFYNKLVPLRNCLPLAKRSVFQEIHLQIVLENVFDSDDQEKTKDIFNANALITENEKKIVLEKNRIFLNVSNTDLGVVIDRKSIKLPE